jgi:hypothetical protein
VHATNAFYDALARVDQYDTLPVTVAAQRVQRSGYPSAYAVYENDARALASALTGYSPAAFWCHLPEPDGTPPPAVRRAAAVRRALAPAFGPVAVRVGTGSRLEVAASSPTHGWALAAYLVSRARGLGLGSVTYAGRVWTAGDDAGWRDASGDRSTSVVVLH